MKRVFRYLLVIICLAIYILSCSDDLTTKFTSYKIAGRGLIKSDRYRYGDLYGMAYLPWFREQYQPDTIVKNADCGPENNLDLYVISDSYVWPLFTSNKFYCRVNKLNNIKTNNGEILNQKLDSSKTNVLLIEFSERNVRPILDNASYTDNIISKRGFNKLNIISQGKKSIGRSVSDVVFNRRIKSNLEANVFDFSFLTFFKELKASINYKLFNEIDNNVKITKDGQQLYYAPTIDTADIMSAFKSVTNEEKDSLVSRLNKIYNNGKMYGFKEVYITIIPNPVSILDPQFCGLHYNDLLNRIQSDPKLKVHFINIWPEFKHLKNKVYQHADSHWNRFGAYKWLDKVNIELSKIAEEGRTH